MSETPKATVVALVTTKRSALARSRDERSGGRSTPHSLPAMLTTPASSTALSSLERLSVALRAAELSGVDSLAQHYRARLAKEAADAKPSGRVPAILRYSELAALYPANALSAERAKLANAGLQTEEIAALSEITALVVYQARIIIAFGC